MSPDIRGIDCSLVYSTEVGYLPGVASGERERCRAHVLVNHWPSCRVAPFESEPQRLTVAERCGQLVDQILKLDRKSCEPLAQSAASLG
jgi:hypothetical protein